MVESKNTLSSYLDYLLSNEKSGLESKALASMEYAININMYSSMLLNGWSQVNLFNTFNEAYIRETLVNIFDNTILLWALANDGQSIEMDVIEAKICWSVKPIESENNSPFALKTLTTLSYNANLLLSNLSNGLLVRGDILSILEMISGLTGSILNKTLSEIVNSVIENGK